MHTILWFIICNVLHQFVVVFITNCIVHKMFELKPTPAEYLQTVLSHGTAWVKLQETKYISFVTLCISSQLICKLIAIAVFGSNMI